MSMPEHPTPFLSIGAQMKLTLFFWLTSAQAFKIALQNKAQEVLRPVQVPVQLGVMSRCPDALICERAFDQVLSKVGNKVDISLVYIAKLNTSNAEFGATCMHGPEECAGNVQQLCAAKYTPTKNWWEFVQCQNYQGRENIGTPDVAFRCAGAAGFEWETSGVGKCAGLDGSGTASEGVSLFHDSIELSHQLGVTKSCTVLINKRVACVHDGTWKECDNGHTVNDFIRQIEEEYERLN